EACDRDSNSPYAGEYRLRSFAAYAGWIGVLFFQCWRLDRDGLCCRRGALSCTGGTWSTRHNIGRSDSHRVSGSIERIAFSKWSIKITLSLEWAGARSATPIASFACQCVLDEPVRSVRS